MDQLLIELKARVERLEQAVFSSPLRLKIIQKSGGRSGPTQGILNLVASGFFNPPNRRTMKEVMMALVKEGKDYSHQAVHIALQRLSGGKKSTLIRHKDKQVTSYVIRG